MAETRIESPNANSVELVLHQFGNSAHAAKSHGTAHPTCRLKVSAQSMCPHKKKISQGVLIKSTASAALITFPIEQEETKVSPSEKTSYRVCRRRVRILSPGFNIFR